MPLILILVLFGLGRPAASERSAACTVIEHNTIMQGDDCKFEQVIFWVRRYPTSDIVAAHWVNASRVEIRRRGIETVAVYYENGLRHVVRAKSYKESVTDYDPEAKDRQRRGGFAKNLLFPEFTPTGIDR